MVNLILQMQKFRKTLRHYLSKISWAYAGVNIGRREQLGVHVLLGEHLGGPQSLAHCVVSHLMKVIKT